jgi:hypothetical protein
MSFDKNSTLPIKTGNPHFLKLSVRSGLNFYNQSLISPILNSQIKYQVKCFCSRHNKIKAY